MQHTGKSEDLLESCEIGAVYRMPDVLHTGEIVLADFLHDLLPGCNTPGKLDNKSHGFISIGVGGGGVQMI